MFKLSQARMNDLLSVVNSLTPAEIGDFKANRKLLGAAEALEKANKSYLDKFEEISKKSTEVVKFYQQKFAELNAKTETPKVKLEKEKLEREGNAALVPFNTQLAELEKAEGGIEVECEMDANYFNELKEQFKKHGDKKYKSSKAFVETGVALGIEE